jgi:hypothetical protein
MPSIEITASLALIVVLFFGIPASMAIGLDGIGHFLKFLAKAYMVVFSTIFLLWLLYIKMH